MDTVSVHLKKGFTLIELLIVIGILGILMTIMITSYGNSVQHAHDQQIKANVDSIRTSLELYRRSTSDGYYPITLRNLQTANFNVPNFPRTNSIDGYNYLPLPPGCEVVGMCSSYEITAVLESTDEVYVATPQSIDVKKDPAKTPTPTLTNSQTPSPTNTPTPVQQCVSANQICEDIYGNTTGSCCSGFTCQAITFDGTKRCALPVATNTPTPVQQCVSANQICEDIYGNTTGSCCSGLTCQAITFDGTKRCALPVATNTPTPVQQCISTNQICEDIYGNTTGSCCSGLTCQAITFDGTKRCATSLITPVQQCIGNNQVCQDTSGETLGTCCSGLTCRAITFDGTKRCTYTN